MKKKKTKKELKEYRRIHAKKYYHKNKDKINRERRKTKIQISRKKRSTRRKMKHYTSDKIISTFEIVLGGKLRVYCPVHKNEFLKRLVYNTAIRKKPTQYNKRGITGKRGQTNWYYCSKCDIARKVPESINSLL